MTENADSNDVLSCALITLVAEEAMEVGTAVQAAENLSPLGVN